MTKPKRIWWLIVVHFWGEKLLFGTEDEAELWRCHKCCWEQSIAKKYPLICNKNSSPNKDNSIVFYGKLNKPKLLYSRMLSVGKLR